MVVQAQTEFNSPNVLLLPDIPAALLPDLPVVVAVVAEYTSSMDQLAVLRFPAPSRREPSKFSTLVPRQFSHSQHEPSKLTTLLVPRQFPCPQCEPSKLNNPGPPSVPIPVVSPNPATPASCKPGLCCRSSLRSPLGGVYIPWNYTHRSFNRAPLPCENLQPKV